MSKIGMGAAEIAFGSLLLMNASDYIPFAQMGQADAVSRIQAGLPSQTIRPSTQDATVFDARTNFLASQMSQSMRDAIDNIMQKGIASGATYGMMHDQILQSFGLNPADMTATGWRAQRIANTESMFAVREGALQKYINQGITMVNLVIMDSACDECIDIASDNPYTIQDADAIGDGGLHPNCRCLWEPDQEEFAQNFTPKNEDTFAKKTVQKDDSGGTWVTINGQHVLIGGDGNPTGASHSADSHAGGVEADQGWKPSGTEAEATVFAQDSKDQTTYYHGTSAAGADQIEQNGFDPSKSGVVGQLMGKGTYLTSDKSSADWYALQHAGDNSESAILSMKIDVQNPYSIEDTQMKGFIQEVGTSYGLTPYNTDGSVNSGDNATVISKISDYLSSQGYDAFSEHSAYTKETITVAFNPKDIMTFANDKRQTGDDNLPF